VLSLLRFLVVLFCLNVIVRFLVRLWRAVATPTHAPREAPRSGVTLVRDRVCNTFLPQERALRAAVGGREEYFCSEGCRSRAMADGAGSGVGIP
jgi:hypothetical protein